MAASEEAEGSSAAELTNVSRIVACRDSWQSGWDIWQYGATFKLFTSSILLSFKCMNKCIWKGFFPFSISRYIQYQYSLFVSFLLGHWGCSVAPVYGICAGIKCCLWCSCATFLVLLLLAFSTCSLGHWYSYQKLPAWFIAQSCYSCPVQFTLKVAIESVCCCLQVTCTVSGWWVGKGSWVAWQYLDIVFLVFTHCQALAENNSRKFEQKTALKLL